MASPSQSHSNLSNREAYLRMNFLYQAAALFASRESKGPEGQVGSEEAQELSRFYVRTLRDVAQKLVIRVDKNVKQTICKTCNSLVLPSINSGPPRIRRKRRGIKVHQVNCPYCQAPKRKVLSG